LLAAGRPDPRDRHNPTPIQDTDMTDATIVIADDHSLLRMGLKAMLAIQPGLSVIGEASNGRQAVELAEALRPDVIIMDLMMPELNGAEATRQILSIRPETKIIVLTSFGDSPELLRAVRNGASGVQLKEDPEENLVQTIRAVLNGETCIDKDIRRQADAATDPPPLTQKQSEILHAVSRGLTNKDIARMFGITEVGVQKHLKLIFAKICAANRSEAIGIAIRKHILKI